jgi:hypothetical protein
MDFTTAQRLKSDAWQRFGRERTYAYAVERRDVAAAVALDSQTSHGLRDAPALRETGFGIGIALAGEGRCQLAIRYPWTDQSRAPHLEELRHMASGEVDVAWTGPVIAQASSATWPQQPARPLQIGTSVANHGGTAGTICAFVTRQDGITELLSCNHVLALCGSCTQRDAVWQPGPSDGGTSTSTIGWLSDWVELDRRGVNLVDAALARLEDGIAADPHRLEGYPDLAGSVPSAWYASGAEEALLAKLGRTTQNTEGRIKTLSLTQTITYEGFGDCVFDQLIEITGTEGRFSEGGDSGSLVFKVDAHASQGVAMIVAGSSTASYAVRLDTVLTRLSANLVA